MLILLFAMVKPPKICSFFTSALDVLHGMANNRKVATSGLRYHHARKVCSFQVAEQSSNLDYVIDYIS